jgi:5'-3' exonuclease
MWYIIFVAQLDWKMTVNIIDTNALVYMLAYSADKQDIGETDFDRLDKFIQMNLMYLLSGACLNSSDSTAKYLFVGDSKPYWRAEPLAKIGVNYKGRAKSNYRYKACIPLMTTLLESFLAKQNIYVLYKENYEADDLAAMYVKFNRGEEIRLITVDTDWLPLTINPKTVWYSLKECNFRIADKTLALKRFNSDKAFNDTIAKRAFLKTCISQLWEFKAIFGDKSDNIPGNKDKSIFLPYIDLFNPDKSYDLSNCRITQNQLKQYCSKEIPQIGFNKFISKISLPYDLAISRF